MALAIVLVGVTEVAFRMTPPASRLSYGTGLSAYYEARHSIQELGAAEVAVVGSSRGRESLSMPELARLLSGTAGRDVRVANYSCGDATADDVALIVRDLLASPTQPRVLVYVVTPRVLRGDNQDPVRREIFGEFPNEYGTHTASWLAALSERPMWNLRNALGDHFATFRYRYSLRYRLTSALRGRSATSPIQGGYTQWQSATPDRSLVTHPVSEARIRDYVANLLEDGRYVLGESRVDALRETLTRCNQAGVHTVLLAAPLSAELLAAYPADLYPRFLQLMTGVAAEAGVELVTAEDLGLRLDREDFREQSHLNLGGATKVTRALVEKARLTPVEKPPPGTD